MWYDVYGNKYNTDLMANYSRLMVELRFRLSQIRDGQEKKHNDASKNQQTQPNK